MAAGEYVSVHSQADTEKADIERERKELKTDDAGEHKELAAIYVLVFYQLGCLYIDLFNSYDPTYCVGTELWAGLRVFRD